MATRTALWRVTFLGGGDKGRPGQLVRASAASGARHRAYLRSSGRPTWIVSDHGPGTRADFEVRADNQGADFVPRRLWVPYGVWTLGDGSEVVFSRDYLPLWRIIAERIERPEPGWWVLDAQQQRHFGVELGLDDYRWDEDRTLARALDYLKDKGVSGLPKLVDAMAHLMRPGVRDIPHAVGRSLTALGEPPSWAAINSRLREGDDPMAA